MALNHAQLQTLKASIAADPALAAQPNTPDGAFAIADAFNEEVAGPFVVWRTSVDISEIMANGFVWPEVDALPAGKARIWQWMSQLGSINPSKANVRQGLRDCFEVSAPNTFGNRTTGVGGIQPHLRRNATRAEALFATGTGTTATPATMTFEGRLTYEDVLAARAA